MKDGSWEREEVKVLHGHHEEAIPASELPNMSSLFKLNYQYIDRRIYEYHSVAMEIGDTK